MPEETRPESSSPAVEFEQVDSPPFQIRESIQEEPPRELAAQAAKELTVQRTRRRARDATTGAQTRPTGAPIAGPSSEIAERAEEESGGPTPVRTSAAIASKPAEQSAEKEKAVAPEIIRAAPLHSLDPIAKSPAALRETTEDEVLHAAVGSPEALPEESEEIKQTVTNRISSRVPVVRWTHRSAKLPAAIRKPLSVESRSASRLPSRADPAPWEIERKLQLERGPQPTMQDVLAKWRDALWEALHGRWSEAGWEFARGIFRRLTRAATWRRVGKAVLNFLARFVPGHESYVLRRSREIKELFRELHEEPKKPGTWSNCPK